MFLLGLIYLLYGIIKIIICVINIILNELNYLFYKSIPFIKYFIDNDYSQAHKYFNILLLIFSIYTLLLGIVELNIINNEVFKNFILSDYLYYIVFFIIGFVMTLLYIFIIYFPDISKKYITRNDDKINIYKTIYLICGLVFLITLNISLLYKNFNIILLLLLILLLLCILLIILTTDDIYKNIKKEFITILMIPLSSI